MNKRKNVDCEITLKSSPVKQQCVVNNVCETEKILRELSRMFPEEQFLKRIPCVVMKHMIYSKISNRTVVDKEIVNSQINFFKNVLTYNVLFVLLFLFLQDELTKNGVIRLFKLGSEEESLAVLFMDQYKEIIIRKCSDLSLTKKFISRILDKIKETTVEKEALIKAHFTEENIKFVAHFFLITQRDVGQFIFYYVLCTIEF